MFNYIEAFTPIRRSKQLNRIKFPEPINKLKLPISISIKLKINQIESFAAIDQATNTSNSTTKTIKHKCLCCSLFIILVRTSIYRSQTKFLLKLYPCLNNIRWKLLLNRPYQSFCLLHLLLFHQTFN